MTTLTPARDWTEWDPFGEDVHADPYPFYAALREEAPCVRLEKYGVWFVSRYPDVSRVLTDWETFTTATGNTLMPTDNPLESGVFVSSAPPDHTRLRKAIIDDFKPKVLGAREPRVRELTAELVRQALHLGTVDWAKHFCEALPTTVMAEMLGFPERHREDYTRWASAAIAATAATEPAGAQAAWRGMNEFVDELCRNRELVAGGWGERVLRRVDEGVLSYEEANAILGGILAGAMDTTVNLLGNVVQQFVTFPDQWELLRQNRDLAGNAVEESLRFDAPTQPGFFRAAAEDVELAGARLRPADRVMIGFGSANRDPREFNEPDRFDITRRPNRHLSFGRGLHMCLGAPVARLIARVALEELAGSVRRFEPAGHPRRKDSPAVRGFASLPVHVEGAP